jgi:hypothetical protein
MLATIDLIGTVGKGSSRNRASPSLHRRRRQTGLISGADHLAVPLAREGDPLPIDIEETDKNFTIGWTGTQRSVHPLLSRATLDRTSCTYSEGT